jgi:hypothetical protein
MGGFFVKLSSMNSDDQRTKENIVIKTGLPGSLSEWVLAPWFARS